MKIKFKKKQYKILFSWKFPFIIILRVVNSINPTGNVSISCITTNSGIESLYNHFYKKTIKLKQ